MPETIRQSIITDAEVRSEIRAMVDLPAEIEQQQRLYTKMSIELAAFNGVGDAKQELNEARGTISFLVEHEVYPDLLPSKDGEKQARHPKAGKPIYGNQAARDLETNKRCRDDSAYQSALAQLGKVEGDLFAKKAELEDQAATIKRLVQSLSVRKSILNAVAGLAQEQTHSDELKLIAKFRMFLNEIGGNNHDE